MTPFAFVLVHFGDKIQYLELELYFFINLRLYTKQDIIYLYSITDTPPKFVKLITPYVTKCISYDDNGITFNVDFKSNYTIFNTLRTCNFIFAYKLTNYKKICLIESDMIIMKPIDAIFDLKTPSILIYAASNIKQNYKNHLLSKTELIKKVCVEKKKIINGVNGGVIVFTPSIKMFNFYLSNLKPIIDNQCPYPNESLFIYCNSVSYNLPIWYNLSYHHLSDWHLNNMKLIPTDLIDHVVIYHYNETFKPTTVMHDKWYLQMDETQVKNIRRKLPILHYKGIFDAHFDEIEKKLESI